MGKLVDGKWVKGSVITSDDSGAYDRIPRSFLDTVSEEHDTFKPESGRYHLYVSYACPWAHRTLIFRELKDLGKHISLSVVHPEMLEMGWSFKSDFEGSTGDDLYQSDFLHQIYQKAQSDVSTSVTVPILWDKKEETIVNNESSEIIRIFNSSFNKLTGNQDDYYPSKLREEIDQWNDKIYSSLNNGVYKCGFAKNQEAYNEAVEALFKTLDELEDHLKDNKFLVGNQLTEADVRLFPSLIRFDPVYHVHFKCSYKKIAEYKNLYRYTLDLLKNDAFKKTTHLNHIKRHYYYSHEDINPHQIIPKYDGHSYGL